MLATDGTVRAGVVQGDGVLLDAQETTPPDPEDGQARLYVKGGKLVIQSNNDGRVLYTTIRLDRAGRTLRHDGPHSALDSSRARDVHTRADARGDGLPAAAAHERHRAARRAEEALRRGAGQDRAADRAAAAFGSVAATTAKASLLVVAGDQNAGGVAADHERSAVGFH